MLGRVLFCGSRNCGGGSGATADVPAWRSFRQAHACYSPNLIEPSSTAAAMSSTLRFISKARSPSNTKVLPYETVGLHRNDAYGLRPTRLGAGDPFQAGIRACRHRPLSHPVSRLGAMAMKCPHCQHAIHETRNQVNLGPSFDGDSFGFLEWAQCPADGCNRFILWLLGGQDGRRLLVHPSTAPPRPPAPAEVPEDIRKDYDEAGAVLPVSAKASGALSRRCLQHVLRDAGGVAPSTLFKEIEEVLAVGSLPSHLAENLDYVRVVGNYAAHPEKDQMGVVDVEPGEAEWTLEVLEGLFDHYYVKPAIARAKRQALETKTGKTLRQSGP